MTVQISLGGALIVHLQMRWRAELVFYFYFSIYLFFTYIFLLINNYLKKLKLKKIKNIICSSCSLLYPSVILFPDFFFGLIGFLSFSTNYLKKKMEFN